MSTTSPATDLVHHRVNTLSQLQQLRGVAGMVEVDVFLVDGRLVILHHHDYGKTAEEIEQMTWSELQHLTHGEAPLLDDYLHQAASWGIGVIIEIKGSSEIAATATIHRAIAAIAEMRRQGMLAKNTNDVQRSLIIHSFSLVAMRAAQQAMKQNGTQMNTLLGWSSSPTIATAEILCRSSADAAREILRLDPSQKIEEIPLAQWHEAGIMVCVQNRFSAIAIRADQITPQLVHLAHEEDIRINAYRTKNDDVERLRSIGVDLITVE